MESRALFAHRLGTDTAFRDYLECRSRVLPDFLQSTAWKGLGALWPLLPDGALAHNWNAHLDSANDMARAAAPRPVDAARGAAE